MGVVEGNRSATEHDWEKTTSGGSRAFKRWIDDQLDGESCNVALIGEETAGRKWFNYEIEASWNKNGGVVGVFIHRLKDLDGNPSSKGSNPFGRVYNERNSEAPIFYCESLQHRRQRRLRILRTT
jgi:hypothetical protein